jgi:hypothetical protein
MPLATTIPLALLPVRLETKFVEAELRVRIYPDAIHVDTHEPEFTDDERAARAEWIASTRDAAAWRRLVERTGVARAGYLAALPDTVDPGRRDEVWTRAAIARLLPDRWTVVVQGPRLAPIRVEGAPIAADVVVGVGPELARDDVVTDLSATPETAWIADFGEAVRAGMAVNVPLPPRTDGPLDVLVFGVRDRDPGSEASALAELFAAHRATCGLALRVPGTPTNHLGDGPAPWSSIRGADDELARAVGDATPGPGSVGAALAAALGVPLAAVARVAEATTPWIDTTAAAMHAALWPATLGYFLEQMLDGADVDPATSEAVRRLYVDHVRGRGPLPVLQVGRVPYGVLPIAPLAAWRDGPGGDTRIPGVLRRLRAVWDAAISSVPRLGQDADALATIFAMAPTWTELVGRSVLGAGYVSYLHEFVRRPLRAAWWSELAARTRIGWSRAGLPDKNTRLARATYADVHFRVPGPVVAASLAETAPPPYLGELASGTLEQIRARTSLGAGTPLLYRIARHAVLASYLAAARRLHGGGGRRLDPEMIGATAAAPPWTWLDEGLASGQTVRTTLDAACAGSGAPVDAAFQDVWTGLATLATRSPRELDATFRDALDACSHRLDAWIVALASARLAAMRATTPSGLHVGGYGYVEGLVRAPPRRPGPAIEGETGPVVEADAPGGHVLVPSPAHVATAAILRSGHLAHGGAATSTFAVDLGSARVRAALDILGAIRAGGSLGEALGRRIERAIVAREQPVLWPFLPAVRALVAPGRPFTEAIPVDGYALVQRARQGPLPFGAGGLPPAGSPAAHALDAIIDDAERELDAVGDLLVAESVHQLASGEPARAATSLDALALGEPPPAELGVLEVPAPGLGLEHRVLVVIPADARAAGWASTPRARLEPALEAWCAALLGPASRYRVRVARTDTAADLVIGLDALDLGALDAVRAAATGELAPRVLEHAARTLGAPIAVSADRVGDAATLDEAIALATGIADVLSRARPARAHDLAVTATAPDPAAVSELAARVDPAVLDTALAALAADPRAGLRRATELGVAGTVPARDPARWPEQAAAAAAVLAQRRARLAAPDSGADDPWTRAIERARLVAGDDLPVSAHFAGAGAELIASAAGLGVDAETIAGWLATVGAARAGAAALERALLLADTLAPSAAEGLALAAAQLPHRSGDAWIGGPAFAAATPIARRGWTIHAPLGLALDAPLYAILVDAWTELVPARARTAAVAFHLEQPTATPAHAILLAVPPDDAATWTGDAVEAVVRETIALAKLRLVDSELLGDAGHFLPALYFAINLGGDTASTDFTEAG